MGEHRPAWAPARIYLQDDDSGETGRTWCEDRIGAGDVAYLRADIFGLPRVMGTWRPIATAPKDRTDILVRLHDENPRYGGRYFVARHPGIAPDGFDMGWSLFPGYGGVEDVDIAGWTSLPGQETGESDCAACRTCLADARDEGTGMPVTSMRMIVCPDCGNKRCPKATNHRFACTHSNDPDQPGSGFGALRSTPLATAPPCPSCESTDTHPMAPYGYGCNGCGEAFTPEESAGSTEREEAASWCTEQAERLERNAARIRVNAERASRHPAGAASANAIQQMADAAALDEAEARRFRLAAAALRGTATEEVSDWRDADEEWPAVRGEVADRLRPKVFDAIYRVTGDVPERLSPIIEGVLQVLEDDAAAQRKALSADLVRLVEDYGNACFVAGDTDAEDEDAVRRNVSAIKAPKRALLAAIGAGAHAPEVGDA